MTRSSKRPVPRRRQVSQSWGRQMAAMRAAVSGSLSATQRSLVMVSEATGALPTAAAHAARPAARSPPPNSLISSPAAPALRVSFHSRAGRITSPPASSSTMPCC